MCRYQGSLPALFVACLIIPMSVAFAQFASGDTEIPTGDVWPSREERVVIPRKALRPNSVDDESNTSRSMDQATPNVRQLPPQIHPVHRSVGARGRNRYARLGGLPLCRNAP